MTSPVSPRLKQGHDNNRGGGGTERSLRGPRAISRCSERGSVLKEKLSQRPLNKRSVGEAGEVQILSPSS